MSQTPAASTVTLSTPDGAMDAYLARPAGDGPFPAMLVAQEAFGVNDYIEDICRRLAAEGYVALAPELYHRTGRGVRLSYDHFDQVRPHFSKVTNDGLTGDVKTALAHLRSLDEVQSDRVGAIGFCLGGFVAFLSACRTNVKTAVAFYGGGIAEKRPNVALDPLLDEAKNIHVPVLCFFGAEDNHIPPQQVDAIRQRLDALSDGHEVMVFPGAGHGFFCDQRGSYHPESAAKAWEKTKAWLAEHLR